ncbi:MAG: LamG-like jellyroll fold domain-containing protein [Sedimentisphaeraceae bacterium JB056]
MKKMAVNLGKRNMLLAVVALMCCLIVSSNYAGTVAYWEFNDVLPGETVDSGTRIIDSSGNGRDGYINGGDIVDVLEFTDGDPGYGESSAANFTASDDELIFEPGHDFGDEGSLSGDWFSLENQSFTFETAVRFPKTSASLQNGLCRYLTETSRELWWRIEGGNLRFGNYAGGWASANTTGINFFDAQWHHLAIRFTATTTGRADVDMFVDYELVLSYEGGYTSFTGTGGSLYIGNFQQMTSDMVGGMDFFKISDTALDVSDFVQIVPKPTNPFPEDGSVNNATTGVSLSWDQIAGVTVSSNTVTVSRTADMNNIVESFNITSGNSVNLDVLGGAATYFWRVDTVGTDPNDYAVDQEGDVWSFSTVDVNTDVAAFWTFDDKTVGMPTAAGDVIYDISGNGRDLYASESEDVLTDDSMYYTPAPGYDSDASYFGDESFEFILEPGYDTGTSFAGSQIPIGENSFTFESLVKLENDTNVILLVASLVTDEERYWISNNYPQFWCRVEGSGKLVFSTTDNSNWSYVESPYSIRDGQWHHIACVRDVENSLLKLYVDYVNVAEAADATGSLIMPGTTVIGGSILHDAWNFEGVMDFAKISYGALLPADFEQALCSSLPSSPYPEDDAVAVDPSTTLSWTPASCGTIVSQNVVIATDELMQTVVETIPTTSNSVTPTALDTNEDYYWRVDTVTDTDTVRGNIWLFSTPKCLIEASTGDINGDCAVNSLDLAIMAANWLRMNEYETLN